MFAQQEIPPLTIETISSSFDASTVEPIDLLVAAIALVAGFVVGALTRRSVRRVLGSMPGLGASTISVIARLSGYLFVVLGFVVALSAVGLSFGPVITILLSVALVAVLVGRPMLADLGAGVVLQSRRPIAVGDVVRIDGDEGVVEDIDGRVVRIRTFEGWRVRVRNSRVLEGPITTTAEPHQVRIEFFVGVHYDTDLDQAVVVARDALVQTEGVQAQPAPEVLVDEFGESTINLRCWLWVDPVRRWQVKDLAHRTVKRALDANEIVIAFPQRVVHHA